MSLNLDDVVIDPKARANINYVKCRMAIDETMKSRKARRDAKMAVIEALKGTIKHPTEKAAARGATKMVEFPDSSRAAF